ncbi:Inovirus Gp2 [compost metagenome]
MHPTVLFYFWVREVNAFGRPHYHFAFLLNEDAYFKLGNLAPTESNTFDRLQRAWVSALRLDDVSQAKGLVNVPDNAEFSLRGTVGDPGVAAFFRRTSYFCKVATKVFIGRTRNRGCSRR